jgi:hypothetical protein
VVSRAYADILSTQAASSVDRWIPVLGWAVDGAGGDGLGGGGRNCIKG